ncbi:hypothetical protein D3C77_569920 [compost metagenome]
MRGQRTRHLDYIAFYVYGGQVAFQRTDTVYVFTFFNHMTHVESFLQLLRPIVRCHLAKFKIHEYHSKQTKIIIPILSKFCQQQSGELLSSTSLILHILRKTSISALPQQIAAG